jgi:hypothetical protein
MHFFVLNMSLYVLQCHFLSSHEVMAWWLRLGSMADKVVGLNFTLDIRHYKKSQIWGFNGLFDVIQQSTSNANPKKIIIKTSSFESQVKGGTFWIHL